MSDQKSSRELFLNFYNKTKFQCLLLWFEPTQLPTKESASHSLLPTCSEMGRRKYNKRLKDQVKGQDWHTHQLRSQAKDELGKQNEFKTKPIVIHQMIKSRIVMGKMSVPEGNGTT